MSRFAILLSVLVLPVMVVSTAHARPGDIVYNNSDSDATLMFEKSGGAIYIYTLRPGKCAAFAYPGSDAGSTCAEAPCGPSNGGLCFELKPRTIWLNGVQIYPRPKDITGWLENHPNCELITELYADLFQVELNGQWVRATVITNQWAEAKKAFLATQPRYPTIARKGLCITKPQRLYAYETVEFDEDNQPHPVWKFAGEPTISVVIDGNIRTRPLVDD